MNGLNFLPFLFLAACGNITLGTQGLNEPTPTGTIVAYGNITPLSDTKATGSAKVYRTQCSGSTCNYTVRLENLTLTSSTPVFLIVTLTSGRSSQMPVLRSFTGSLNYSFTGISSSETWVQLALHPSNLIIGNNDLATVALLQTQL